MKTVKAIIYYGMQILVGFIAGGIFALILASAIYGHYQENIEMSFIAVFWITYGCLALLAGLTIGITLLYCWASEAFEESGPTGWPG